MNRTITKAAAIVAALTLSASLTACNRDSEGGDKVLLALSTQTNPFFVQLRDGAQAKADELGVELEIQDASDDAATQVNQLNNAATTGADVVIVNPVDSDAVTPAVTQLNNANIPVVAVDRGVNGADVASFISSDNVAGGRQAAEEVAKAVEDEGSVLVLQGTPGSSSSRDRGAGFEEGLKSHPGIKVAAKQTANFDRAEALNVTTNLLQANPDVKAVFAENDEMALGAIEALGDRAGTEVPVVGFDGTEDGLAAIKDGTLTATVAQQPAELGALAVEQAKKILDGQEAESEVPVEVLTVTKENVGEFE